jgi:two-component system, OmpR family, phosphate regulon sensor histidine kinase PhoR
MTWSIRWKLTLGTLVAVACGLLIAGAMTVQALEQQYLVQFAEALVFSSDPFLLARDGT